MQWLKDCSMCSILEALYCLHIRPTG